MGKLHLQSFVSEHRAVSTSRLRITGRPFLLATWEREGEAPIHGEAAPLSGYGADDFARAQTALAALSDAELETVTRAVVAAFGEDEEGALLRPNSPLGALAAWSEEIASPAARFCAETLVLSAAAQACRVPLWRLLARECVAPELKTSSVVDPLASDWFSEFAEKHAQGIRTFKFKCGRDSKREKEAVLRAASFPAVRLRFDPNGAFDLNEAVRFLEGLPLERIDWMEDPTSTMSEWGPLRDLTGVPLALDEPLARGLSRDDADLLAPDVVVLKPMALGGFSPSAKWAEWARERGASVCVSHLFDGNTAMNATIQLAFVVQDPHYAAGLGLHQALASDPSGTPRARGLLCDTLSCPTKNGNES